MEALGREFLDDFKKYVTKVFLTASSDSLKSDGIPVGSELSGDGDQYIWSSDHDEADNPDKLPDLTSQYPPEELPERFSEVSSLVGFIFDQVEANGTYPRKTLFRRPCFLVLW